MRTQDLRRGHSKDMKDHGSTMRDILAAGEWRFSQISYISLVIDEKDSVKFDLFALFSVQAVDENLLVFFYLKLVPCDLYDCIHDD